LCAQKCGVDKTQMGKVLQVLFREVSDGFLEVQKVFFAHFVLAALRFLAETTRQAVGQFRHDALVLNM
jgi:hypothetical protein